MSRDDTTVIWHFKKFCFWINPDELLYQLNFANWVELKKSHAESREV